MLEEENVCIKLEIDQNTILKTTIIFLKLWGDTENIFLSEFPVYYVLETWCNDKWCMTKTCSYL